MSHYDKDELETVKAERDELRAKLSDAKSLADHHLLAANGARAKLAAQTTELEACKRMIDFDLVQLLQEAKEKLAALEAEKAEREKQEPAAYINHKAMMPPSLDSAATPGTLYSEPLYLSAGAQPREPMTKDEMADMFKAVGIDGYDEREKLVRAVEAHHKIGAKEILHSSNKETN